MRAATTTRISAALLTGLSCLPCARASEELPVTLSWNAPATSRCPDAAYVFGELRRYISGAASGMRRAPIAANANIRQVENQSYQLVLKTKDGEVEGERVFQDASCKAVADAAVVVIAWMVDPDAMESQTLPAVVQAQPATSPAPKDYESSPSQTLAHRSPKAVVGLGIAGDLGSLPSAALGAEARGGARLGPIWLQARGAYWPRRSKAIETLPDGRTAGATFALWTLGLETCVEVYPTLPLHFGLGVCAGPALDIVRGAGFGVSAPNRASKRWLSLTGSLQGTVSLAGPLHLFVYIGGVLPTEREHFTLQGVGEVYRPAAIAGRASTGLELQL